jgi:hypothetical protein
MHLLSRAVVNNSLSNIVDAVDYLSKLKLHASAEFHSNEMQMLQLAHSSRCDEVVMK